MSETSEIVNDCLTHYNQRHIQVRWDYFTLCVYNPDQYNQKVNDKGHVIKDEPNQECMAKILRIMETLTDAKRLQWHIDAKNAREKGLTPPQEPKEWPIELAYEAIVELLYHTFGENIVRNSVAVLLERGYIKRYQAGTNTIPIYYLNIPFVQAALKKQAEDVLVGVESNTHVKRRKRVLKITPNGSKVTPKSLKVTPGGVENKDLASESNTNNNSNNTDNDNNTEDESNSDETPKHTSVSSDTARASFEAYSFIVPYTYVEALAYLAPHGGVPPGYGAIEVVKLAQKLYAEAHSQDEQVFTDEKPQGDTPHDGHANDILVDLVDERHCDRLSGLPDRGAQAAQVTPQGDDHATAVPGHSHRVGELATADMGHSHRSGHSAGLEAQQEIDKGEHHAHRVPPLPAANTPAPGKLAVSRHDTDHSHGAALPADGLPVVRVVGSGTTCRNGNQDTDAQGVDGRDAAHTLEQTPTTPRPAQSLSPLPQAEQAASGMTFVEARDYLWSLGYFLEPTPSRNGNWEIREPHEQGFSVIKGDEVRRIAEYQREKHADPNRKVTTFQEQSAPDESADQKAAKQSGKGKKPAQPKPETPKGPPTEPPADMAWGTRKCLMWFDYWRGGILIGKFKLMQASTCAKGLAEQFDEQTVIQARTDMEADPYYAAKGGCDVCDVANNIHKYLKRRQGKQQVAQSVASSVLGASGLPRWTSTGMPLQVVSASARRR